MLLLYLDDLFLIGEEELTKYERRILAIEFEMKNLGMMHWLSGMEVWKSLDGIFFGQGKYVVYILNKFKMLNYKEITTLMESNLNILTDGSSKSVYVTMCHWMVGSLM